MNTVLVSIDSAPFAGRIREWLPDLVRTGLRRVTLFHGIDEERGHVGEELEGLRPELDRLAVALSSQAVETDIALKRGDAIQWMLALATSRRADLLVVEAPADAASPGRLIELLRESRCPVLVFPAHAPCYSPGEGASAAVLPEPLHQ